MSHDKSSWSETMSESGRNLVIERYLLRLSVKIVQLFMIFSLGSSSSEVMWASLS